MNAGGKTSMTGGVTFRVKRKHPTIWQRILDWVRRLG